MAWRARHRAELQPLLDDGLIDEVRISDIARAPTAFIFGPILTPGDVNGDHVVNGLDISQVASHWLASGSRLVTGDANGDGFRIEVHLAVLLMQLEPDRSGPTRVKPVSKISQPRT